MNPAAAELLANVENVANTLATTHGREQPDENDYLLAAHIIRNLEQKAAT